MHSTNTQRTCLPAHARSEVYGWTRLGETETVRNWAAGDGTRIGREVDALWDAARPGHIGPDRG